MNHGSRERTSGCKRWIATACRREVTRRSTRICIIVGTILVAVNYADRWIHGSLEPLDYLKMLLTYLVPYCVSTYVSVETIIFRGQDRNDGVR